jgi:hypothetical protein
MISRRLLFNIEQQLVTVVRNESSSMRTHEQGIRCNVCLLTARVLRLAELIRLLLNDALQKHAIDQRCMMANHDQSISKTEAIPQYTIPKFEQ